MPANLSPLIVRCIIGGVDYSKQVVNYSFSYAMLPPDKAGGVLPFEGTVELGYAGDQHDINCRVNFGLFSIATPVDFSLRYQNTLYPLPPMLCKMANYSASRRRATIVMGDRLFISSGLPQDVDSKALDITIGFNRSGASALSRLLVEARVSNIFREAESPITFMYPRSLGSSYIQAADDIANSERVVVFTAPSGQTVIRPTWTVANPQGGVQYPLPVLGTYRYGARQSAADTISLGRELSECTEVAMPGTIGTKYTATASFFKIYQTDTPQITTTGNTTTRVDHNFGAATTNTTIRTRELGSDIYAGIAGQSSGELESERQEETAIYDRNEPGRLLIKEEQHKMVVAKMAKSLVGWYAADDESVNGEGQVTARPFPGSNWDSIRTAKEVTTTYIYRADKPTVLKSVRVETKMAAILIFDGLTNGVPWDLIIKNSPVALTSLQFASSERTEWIDEGGGKYRKVVDRQQVKSLAETGDRSTIIGGLQKAGEDEDAGAALYWLIQSLKRVAIPRGQNTASSEDAPPAFTPKPRKYTGEGASVAAEVRYRYTSTTPIDVPKSVSIPFASDRSGTSIGGSTARVNTVNFLNVVARRDRMEAFSWNLTSPIYPELLAGLSPYSALDLYIAESGQTYRVISAGLSITGDATEAAISMTAPTLARIAGNQFIHPYQEAPQIQ